MKGFGTKPLKFARFGGQQKLDRTNDKVNGNRVFAEQ